MRVTCMKFYFKFDPNEILLQSHIILHMLDIKNKQQFIPQHNKIESIKKFKNKLQGKALCLFPMRNLTAQ